MPRKTLFGIACASAIACSYYMYYGVARDPSASFAAGDTITLEQLDAALGVHVNSDLTMTKDDNGRTIVRGLISNQTPRYILERLSIKVRIKRTFHCDNDPENPFSKYAPPECKDIRNEDVEETLHEAIYQCYQGNLAFGETAECYTPVAYPFARSPSTHWNFDIHTQYIRPEDPLGIFNHRRQ